MKRQEGNEQGLPGEGCRGSGPGVAWGFVHHRYVTALAAWSDRGGRLSIHATAISSFQLGNIRKDYQEFQENVIELGNKMSD